MALTLGNDPAKLFAPGYIQAFKNELKKVILNQLDPLIEEAVEAAAKQLKHALVSEYNRRTGMDELILRVIINDVEKHLNN